ncbi:hypothetical protein G6F59_015515 [Rhizopus arrhizus]|nr:hypothetical protein G6F59_015515 [Rhizopus arrhizus]
MSSSLASGTARPAENAMLAMPRRKKSSGVSSAYLAPSLSEIAFWPKPGMPRRLAQAIRKVSRQTGSLVAVRATRGCTAGQRTVEALATTSAQGADTPQLSYVTVSGTM